MFDNRLRGLLAPTLDRIAARLDRRGITPGGLTAAGLLTGLGSAGAAAAQLWWPALVLWLLSRALDGLDGPLARHRGSTDPYGGYADIVADFTVYGAFVVGMAFGTGQWAPFMAVLLAYYVNGAAFLAYSSIAERVGKRLDDGRSLSFVGGLTEGAETIAAGAVFCLLPSLAGPLAWVWAAAVAVTAGQRVLFARRALKTGPEGDRPARR
jgi:phosphatidylglycerophosphate synthase